MKVAVELISYEGPPPAVCGTDGRGALDLAAGASVADAVRALGLAADDSMMTLVNGDAVPLGARTGHALAEGDVLTLFPPIKGG